MVRRTKKDAQATRSSILDAAERVFYDKGVAGASLTDVAQAAQVTRGAIYWHFKDKVDLFGAMMERTTLPFEQAWVAKQGVGADVSALQRLLGVLRLVLQSVSADARTRRVFEIALYKMEHVGELAAVRERRVMAANQFVLQMEQDLILAAKQAEVPLRMTSQQAAKGLFAIFDGYLQAWLLRGGGFDLEQEGMAAVQVYLAGLGLHEEKNRNSPKPVDGCG